MVRKFVIVQKEGHIATVTLNRPEVLNALNHGMIIELLELLDTFSSDKKIRVVILEGAGGNFCSGADVSAFFEERSTLEWLEGMKLVGRLIEGLRRIPQPVVVKLRGVAVGAGANMALSGDFVIASHEARFQEIFVHIGLILDGGGTYFLPRLVGLAKARELALLGDVILGEKAAAIGLIYKSTPDGELDEEVSSLANALSQRPPAAISLIKQGLEGSLDKSLTEVLEWESSHQLILLQTQEHKDLIRLFLEMKKKSKVK